MKKHYKLLSILIILGGVLLGYFVTPIKDVHFEIDLSRNLLSIFQFDSSIFIRIFVNNLIVGLIISVGGYFSAGILSILTLFWNGIILGSMFTLFHNLNLTIYQFISMFIFHGILEFYGFVLFATIGYKGYSMYSVFLKKEKLIINLTVKEFLLPVFLILFSAIIETLLITNY